MRRSRHRLLALGAAIGLLVGVDAAGAQPADPAPTPRPAAVPRIADLVAMAERQFGVPAAWIAAVIRTESAGEVRAVSAKGAMGLMQLMPETWSQLRSRYGLGDDPFDTHDNIFAGAAYLRELYERYGSAGFLAAYNAGPGRYEAHLATGLPLPAETRRYLATIAPLIGQSALTQVHAVAPPTIAWTRSPLFAEPSRDAAATSRASINSQGGRSDDDCPARLTALTPLSAGLFVRTAASESRP